MQIKATQYCAAIGLHITRSTFVLHAINYFMHCDCFLNRCTVHVLVIPFRYVCSDHTESTAP